MIRMEVITALETAFPCLQICFLAWVADTLCRLKLDNRCRNASSMINAQNAAQRLVLQQQNATQSIPANARVVILQDTGLTRKSFVSGIPTTVLALTSRFSVPEPNSQEQCFEENYPGSQTEAENTLNSSDVEEASEWAKESFRTIASTSSASMRTPLAPVSANPQKRARKPSQKTQQEASHAAQKQLEKEVQHKAKKRKTVMAARAQSAL